MNNSFNRDYISSHKHYNYDIASSQNSKNYTNQCSTCKNCGLKRPASSTQLHSNSRRQSSISKSNITQKSVTDTSKQSTTIVEEICKEKWAGTSSHQQTEEVKYTDAYRRLIKSHKENSNKIKVKSGRHVAPPISGENTTDIEFDSSADTNQNTVSVSSELAKIQNKIKAEMEIKEDHKAPNKRDIDRKEASKQWNKNYFIEVDNFNKHIETKLNPRIEGIIKPKENQLVTESNYDTVKNVEVFNGSGHKGDGFKYDSIKMLSPSLLRNTAEFGWFNASISPAKTENSNNDKSKEYNKDTLQRLFEDFQSSLIDQKKSNIKSFSSSADNSWYYFYSFCLFNIKYRTNYYEEYMKKFKDKFNLDDSYVSEIKLDLSDDSKLTHNTEQAVSKELPIPIKHQFSIKAPSKIIENPQSSKNEFSQWCRKDNISKTILSAMVLKDFIKRNPSWKNALCNFIFN